MSQTAESCNSTPFGNHALVNNCVALGLDGMDLDYFVTECIDFDYFATEYIDFDYFDTCSVLHWSKRSDSWNGQCHDPRQVRRQSARRRSARSNLASARSTSARSASPAVQRASFRGQVQRVGVRNASARDCATCKSAVHFSYWLPLLRVPVLLLSRVTQSQQIVVQGKRTVLWGSLGWPLAGRPSSKLLCKGSVLV